MVYIRLNGKYRFRIFSGAGSMFIFAATQISTILIFVLIGNPTSIYAVEVTPDGGRAVSGSGAQTIKVWDLENGEVLKTPEGHSDGVRAVAVTPDGRRTVSGSRDQKLKVWDLENGKIVATFFGESPIFSCAIAPDGVTIVAGEQSGRMHFLRLENA